MLPYVCNFLSIGCDFTRWGIDGDRNRVSSENYASEWNTSIWHAATRNNETGKETDQVEEDLLRFRAPNSTAVWKFSWWL